MELRDYQKEAVEAVYSYLQDKPGNPVVLAPTGSGKSVILAQIVKDSIGWGGRVLLLAHVRELLEQNADAISSIAPEIEYGIYSAGLGEKDATKSVVIAGIQSAYKSADKLGHFDLALIDEVHRVPDDEESQYRRLLNGLRAINPKMRIVGFSATPYRTSTGPLCGPDNLFTDICYEISIKELIVKGYLSKLISKTTRMAKVDTSGLHIRAGEFVQEEVEALMGDEKLIGMACLELAERCEERKSCLVFSPGIKHAESVALMMRDVAGHEAVRCVFGDTPPEERDLAVKDFREGRLKYLINVGVYTTGFNAPNVDCVAIFRPTMSPGLWVQMCGRGCRIAEGKTDCLVLDFAENIERHGPIDMVQGTARGGDGTGPAPVKECPQCQSMIAPGYAKCPDCGYEFPPPETPKHKTEAGEGNVISEPIRVPVDHVTYHLHVKKGSQPGAPRTLRVAYWLDAEEFQGSVDEWVCFEHSGYAFDKAYKWWFDRVPGAAAPTSIEQALEYIEGTGIKEPGEIIYEIQGKFKRILSYVNLKQPVEKDSNDIPF